MTITIKFTLEQLRALSACLANANQDGDWRDYLVSIGDIKAIRPFNQAVSKIVQAADNAEYLAQKRKGET